MPFKSPNTILRKLRSFLFVSVLLFPLLVQAYPDQERASLSLVTSQATASALEGNNYLYLTFGTGISRIDLATWTLATDQIPALTDRTASGGPNLTGTINGLAVKDRTLFATQSDGDIIIVDLDHITAVPTTVHISSGALGAAVADPETGTDDDKLYILDKATNGLFIYDIGTQQASGFLLTDEVGTSVSPLAITYMAVSGGSDKIYVSTSAGMVIVVNEGVATVGGRVRLSLSNKELTALATTPDNRFILVVNFTDTKVHVIDVLSFAELDMDSADTANNAILLPDNGSLKGIVVTDVTNPTDTYAYVTGSSGVSVIDLNISGGIFGLTTTIDFNDMGGGDIIDNPMSLTSSAAAGLITLTTNGYIFTSNGNAALSVISDNPFVTIGSTSLGSGSLSTSGSYTVTFQSDEVGTYSVKVGGTLAGTGTEVASGSVSTADSDVTTASIAYNSSLYSEGRNRVYVFVTDSNGHVGHDAYDITVDTPPGAVTITSTGFGDGFVTINFNRLSTTDIDHYNVYVGTDPASVAASATVATTVSQPSSGSSLTGTVSGLTNGTQYYLAVEAVDATSNVGPRATTLENGSAATSTPEVTNGLTRAVGERGCSLIQNDSKDFDQAKECSYLFLIFSIVVLSVFRCNSLKLKKVLLVFLLLVSTNAFAEKDSSDFNPRHWTLDLQGGVWQFTDPVTKDYLGFGAPLGRASFGYLFNGMFGIEGGVGYVGSGGTAVGSSSGASSNTGFNFTIIPFENNLTFRGHFKSPQLFVPYAKIGSDYVLFRENNQGNVVKGFKMGVHGAAGIQFDLSALDEISVNAREEMGLNDVYFILEGRYAWINSFGGSGVDLSGFNWTAGLLFEF